MINELDKVGTNLDCVVIALVRDGKMVSGLRHYTPDKWKNISVWTHPGGRCDAGETFETALRREVAEETGITDFAITKFLGTIPGAKEGDILHVFMGTTDQDPMTMEPEKFSDWGWKEIRAIENNFINQTALELVKQTLHSNR